MLHLFIIQAHFITLVLALLCLQSQGRKIVCKTIVIEHTPLAYAADNFYKDDATSVINGSIPDLTDNTVDLAGNAVTQGFKYYVSNRNYRLIGIIVEAHTASLQTRPQALQHSQTLKEKHIGTMSGTSAEVFVHQLLASVGLSQSEYTTVTGNVCTREPCGTNTLHSQLKDRKIDTLGIREPSVELGIRALVEANTVVFKSSSIYREVYSLYTTKENLRDTMTRQKTVHFVRALNQVYNFYKSSPDKAYRIVAETIDVDIPVLKNVWADHVWGPGNPGKDLVDFLQYEDQYLARAEKREPFSRADLEMFVDRSVYEEAMQGLLC
jgi:ABC-type nitrate/sulfonate/bicarbonate transport system substrate-binding protein